MKRSSAERQAFVETRAAQMAAAPTTAEAKLWEVLEPLGFLQQVTMSAKTKNGGRWYYVMDFYEPKTALCVEADGSSHRKKKGRDRRRDTRLRGEGILTLRITNNRVMKHLEEVRDYVVYMMRQSVFQFGGTK